jgi:hypothetical protein
MYVRAKYYVPSLCILSLLFFSLEQLIQSSAIKVCFTKNSGMFRLFPSHNQAAQQTKCIKLPHEKN